MTQLGQGVEVRAHYPIIGFWWFSYSYILHSFSGGAGATIHKNLPNNDFLPPSPGLILYPRLLEWSQIRVLSQIRLLIHNNQIKWSQIRVYVDSNLNPVSNHNLRSQIRVLCQIITMSHIKVQSQIPETRFLSLK